jgi:hypothetical protein
VEGQEVGEAEYHSFLVGVVGGPEGRLTEGRNGLDDQYDVVGVVHVVMEALLIHGQNGRCTDFF